MTEGRRAGQATREMFYNEALGDALRLEMERDERVIVMGEDIAEHGGAFQVTAGLLERFGPTRIRQTPISEIGIVGASVGAALTGLRPVVELMYVDFSGLAMDQVVNQAAQNRFMFGGQARVPMVLRTQGGSGRGNAAQHSKSLEAWFAHVAGLKLVSLFQHELGVVLGQQQVPAGTGEQPTALTLLRGTPLQGRVVTLDAGLLNAEATQVITTGGGNYVGVVKENYPSVKADIDAWIADQGVAFSPCDPASAGRPDRHQRPWTLRNPGAVAGASVRPRAVSGAGMGLGRGAAGGLAATAAATAASWWVGR